MTAYDSSLFSPPAPVAFVTLAIGVNEMPDVPMLIDSGADVTLIPKKTAVALSAEIEENRSIELEAFDGTRSQAQAAVLDLVFLGKRFRGRFLLTDQNFGILGRNILNHFSLLLDGPNLRWALTA